MHACMHTCVRACVRTRMHTYVAARSLQWEQQLLRHELAFLQCHRVGKVPLLPGTCYIEMARNMAIAVHKTKAFVLARVAFENIIFLDVADLKRGPSVRLHLSRPPASSASPRAPRRPRGTRTRR